MFIMCIISIFLESYAPNLWLRIINRFQLKPPVLIRLYEKQLLKLLVDNYTPTRVSRIFNVFYIN